MGQTLESLLLVQPAHIRLELHLDCYRGGMADVILAGGAESTMTALVLDAYASMGVLSTFNDIA